MTVKSILDLLTEITRDIIELHFEKKKLAQMRINQEALPKKVSEVAQEIYARIHLDELLVTLLDIAMRMTNTECGSIMILEEGDELSIKASRELRTLILKKKIRLDRESRVLLKKENLLSFMGQSNGRIKSLLKRPEIKQSIVMLVVRVIAFLVSSISTRKIRMSY